MDSFDKSYYSDKNSIGALIQKDPIEILRMIQWLFDSFFCSFCFNSSARFQIQCIRFENVTCIIASTKSLKIWKPAESFESSGLIIY